MELAESTTKRNAEERDEELDYDLLERIVGDDSCAPSMLPLDVRSPARKKSRSSFSSLSPKHTPSEIQNNIFTRENIEQIKCLANARPAFEVELDPDVYVSWVKATRIRCGIPGADEQVYTQEQIDALLDNSIPECASLMKRYMYLRVCLHLFYNTIQQVDEIMSEALEAPETYIYERLTETDALSGLDGDLKDPRSRSSSESDSIYDFELTEVATVPPLVESPDAIYDERIFHLEEEGDEQPLFN